MYNTRIRLLLVVEGSDTIKCAKKRCTEPLKIKNIITVDFNIVSKLKKHDFSVQHHTTVSWQTRTGSWTWPNSWHTSKELNLLMSCINFVVLGEVIFLALISRQTHFSLYCDMKGLDGEQGCEAMWYFLKFTLLALHYSVRPGVLNIDRSTNKMWFAAQTRDGANPKSWKNRELSPNYQLEKEWLTLWYSKDHTHKHTNTTLLGYGTWYTHVQVSNKILIHLVSLPSQLPFYHL